MYNNGIHTVLHSHYYSVNQSKMIEVIHILYTSVKQAFFTAMPASLGFLISFWVVKVL